MSDESPCVVCKGTGKNFFNESCTYCNGTGEWNDAALAYLNNHICQCLSLDRKFCPICMKVCHHGSSQTPKQTIDPGFGGQASPKKITINESITTTDSLQDVEVLMVQ